MTIIEGLYFLEEGSNLYARLDGNLKKSDHLPNGIYKLTYSETPKGEIFKFEKRGNAFEVPETRYGDHNQKVSLIVNDYDRLNAPYGAIAVGLKGSGKTMLFNDVCNKLGGVGVPTLLIEDKIDARVLRRVIAMVGPCVVYLDEFGKIYDDVLSREAMLGLFGDPLIKGVLFLVTGNNMYHEFSEFILDRPQRFRYRFDMMEVDREALFDYFDKNHIERRKLAWLIGIRKLLSFDVLNALRPALRTCKTVQEFIGATKYLNVPVVPIGYLQVVAVFHKDSQLKPSEYAFKIVDAKLRMTVNVQSEEETTTDSYEKEIIASTGLWTISHRKPFPIGPYLAMLEIKYFPELSPEESLDYIPLDPYVYYPMDRSLPEAGDKDLDDASESRKEVRNSEMGSIVKDTTFKMNMVKTQLNAPNRPLGILGSH